MVGPSTTDGSACSVGVIKGDSVRFASGDTQLIADRWPGLPAEFHSDIDAAFRTPSGEVFLFKGSNFVSFSDSQHQSTGNGISRFTQPIAGYFSDLPATFQAGLDAALHTSRDTAILICDDLFVEVDPFTGDTVRSSDQEVSASKGTPKVRVRNSVFETFGLHTDRDSVTATVVEGDSCGSARTLETAVWALYDTGEIADPPFRSTTGASTCVENFGPDV
jgi:hypothetical protein